jgi:transposase InsO family protein
MVPDWFKTRWTHFWMRRAGLSRFGRIATRFAVVFAPPFQRRKYLKFLNPHGYVSPEAINDHAELKLGAHVFIGDRVMLTKLLGPAKWTYFYLYVILDVFSRYVTGWMIAHRESAELAKRLIQESCAKQNIRRGQLTLHADRGTSMSSKPVAWPIWESPKHTVARTSPTTTRIRKANSAP